jgi:hypothetical protein
MKNLRLVLGCMLLWLNILGTVQAQQFRSGTIADYSRYWVSAGVGKSRYPSLMGALSFQPQHKNYVLTARYTVSGEVMSEILPGIKISEAAAMGGIRISNFIVSTGVSKVWGVDRGARIGPVEPGSLFKGDRYEKNGYSSFGVPVEVRFMLPVKYVGLGITAFGNLNQNHSYGGLNISIYGGRL